MQTKWVIKELAPVFPKLLRSRRGGVVAATLALTARTGIGYKELATALLTGLKELAQATGTKQARLPPKTDLCPMVPRRCPYTSMEVLPQ